LSAKLNANSGGGLVNGRVILTLNGKPIGGVEAVLHDAVLTSGQIAVSADLRLTAGGANAIIPNGSGNYMITAHFVADAGSKYLDSPTASTASPGPKVEKENLDLGYSGQVFVTANKVGGSADISVGGAVTVADPGTGFITGGGWVTLDDGRKGNFGFTAKTLKSGSVQGNSLFVYRTLTNLRTVGVTTAPNDTRSYNFIVKSNALDGLRTCNVVGKLPCDAQLTGKSNVRAVDR